MKLKELLLELKRKLENQEEYACLNTKAVKGLVSISVKNERGELEEVINFVKIIKKNMKKLGYDFTDNWQE